MKAEFSKMFRAFAFLLLCLALSSLLPGCLDSLAGQEGTELEEARAAQLSGNYLEAEKAYERYLRGNPEGREGTGRWEAWEALVEISLSIRRDNQSAIELLEAMRIEYAEDPALSRSIELQLADQYRELRKFSRAETLWRGVAEDERATVEQRAEAYRDLGDIYLQRLEFSLAAEALNFCVRQKVPDELRAQCLYDLAEVSMATEDLQGAANYLRVLLGLQDTSEDLRLLSIFMLADTLEQQEDNREARDLFKQIAADYPNARVIERRLEFLDTKIFNEAAVSE